MWLGALLLLLGTVGVLVTARIALAVLLAVGPVFVVLALFNGTRGLFVGWLRGLVLTAVTPLLVVVGGGVVLELLVPVVVSLRGVEGVDARSALALFVIACVHVALMAMVLKVAGTMVSAWQVFGLAGGNEPRGRSIGQAAESAYAAPQPLAAMAGAAAFPAARRALFPAASVEVLAAPAAGGGAGGASASRTHITQITPAANPGLPALPRARARGIGSRFAASQAGSSGRVQGLIR
jgi:type IV secretion system protein VirB6